MGVMAWCFIANYEFEAGQISRTPNIAESLTLIPLSPENEDHRGGGGANSTIL